LNAAIIGFGKIAKKHLEVLDYLQCNVTSILSRSYNDTLTSSKKFNIQNVYQTIDDVNIKKTDFFLISVSSENNETVLKQYLKFNKPILIEKPATFSSIALERIISKNPQMLSKVMVGVNRRFYSIFHEATNFLKTRHLSIDKVSILAPERYSDITLKKFSKIVQENWMFANSIHCVDLLRFFAGNIKNIDVKSNFEQKYFSATGFSQQEIEFSYISDWKSTKPWNITLFSENIKIIFEPLEEGKIIENNQIIRLIPSQEDKKFKPGFYAQMQHFIANTVLNNSIVPPASDLRDHVLSLKLIEQIFKPRN